MWWHGIVTIRILLYCNISLPNMANQSWWVFSTPIMEWVLMCKGAQILGLGCYDKRFSETVLLLIGLAVARLMYYLLLRYLSMDCDSHDANSCSCCWWKNTFQNTNQIHGNIKTVQFDKGITSHDKKHMTSSLIWTIVIVTMLPHSLCSFLHNDLQNHTCDELCHGQTIWKYSTWLY